MLRSARTLVFAAVLAAAPAPLHAAAVVVFPLDARGVAKETAELATDQMKSTLRSLKSIDVIETASVEKRLGVHLTEQARACEYDVFCLVEVGEILQSERMIIGHVRRGAKEMPESEMELKLFVLDVAKAKVVDVLLWRVPNQEHSLEEAVQAATRRLFSAPDAELELRLSPPNAEVTFYGDPVPKSASGRIKYWSGAYHARARADGSQTLELRVVIAPGTLTKVPIELQPDLLYVAKPKDPKKSNPFDKASRREGSGVSAQEAGASTGEDGGAGGRRSAFANPIAWCVTGAGIAAGVIGVVVANGAQSDYNNLSKQARYLPGVTLSAAQALEDRDDERSRYRTGSIVALSGAGVAAGALMWMLIDSAISSGPPAPIVSPGRAGGFADVGLSLEVPW